MYYFLTADEILFYNRGDPYFEFTNFEEFPIVLDGKQWPTSEHYFQAQKFVGTPYLNYICTLPTPRDAFSLSRQPQVSQWLQSDWETVKQDVMYKALMAEFSQHSNLRNMLLATGGKRIVEHTANDSYWGDGGNGSGQNNLGKLLMSIRCVLQNPSKRLPDNSMLINILPSTHLDELLNTNAKLTSDAKVTAEQPSAQEAQLDTVNVTQSKPDALVTGELPSAEETPPDALKSTQGESHAGITERQPAAQPDAVQSHDMSDAKVTKEQSASQEVPPEAVEITNGKSNSEVAEEKPNGQHAQSEAVIGKSDASITEEQTCGREVQSEAVYSEFDTLFTEEQLSNALKTSECHAKVTKDQPSPQEAQPDAVSDKSNMRKDTEEQPSTHVA